MRSAPAILALVATLACAGPYAERPPATETTDRTSTEDARPAPAGTGGSEATVIGHVTPDGRVHADTVAQAPAPDPVDRETVVTGYVRAP
ncbi:MAG TPA: hypothetical protein VFG78_06930, partial [Gemmatimonadota bacterium]|nr:hypothetical protein [Gemmatimonadota bacterium]